MNISNRSLFATLGIGILVAGLAVAASAHPFDRVGEELGLTDVQQESVAALRAEFSSARETIHGQREEVIALVNSGNVDAAADLAARQARERVYQRAEMRRRLAEILTPEQLVQMDELRASGEHFKRGRRGRRHAQ